MTDIVEDWLRAVGSKARGRTRYEGQSPFADELVADEIKRLRQQLDAANVESQESTEIIGQLRAERDRLREALRLYGDRSRMFWAPAELQQVIDDALFETENPNG